MAMTFWLPRVAAGLAQVGCNCSQPWPMPTRSGHLPRRAEYVTFCGASVGRALHGLEEAPMAISISYPPTRPIEYPSSDGLPMAESDFQRKPLTYGVEALDIYFQDRPDVYVSGNLFIYYEEGNPQASIAPDVFVVLGAPKHDRSSYLLWNEPKAPDFVLEITSRRTRREDQETKPTTYARLGVQEYWQYDPTGDYLAPALQGFRLVVGHYEPLPAT